MLKAIYVPLLVALTLKGSPLPQALNNDAVVTLHNMGLSDDAVVQLINHEPGAYSLSAEEVSSLSQSGISNAIMSAMSAKIAAPQLATSATNADPIILTDGTRIRLRLKDTLSSSTAKAGQRIEFEVMSDVRVGKMVVFRHGAIAMGSVQRSERKKVLGRGGKLAICVDYVRLPNGDRVVLTGTSEASGRSRAPLMAGGAAAVSFVAWPIAPLFVFIHGADTEIPKGTEIDAYVEGDVELEGLLPTRLLQSADSAERFRTRSR